jgi:transposase-like protein
VELRGLEPRKKALNCKLKPGLVRLNRAKCQETGRGRLTRSMSCRPLPWYPLHAWFLYRVELLRRYSKLDSFQRSVAILAKSLVRSDNGTFRAPSPRPQISPPHPFKLRQRLRPDTIAQIVGRYQAGESSTSLAATFGISKGSVIRLLRDADVPIRNQGLTDDQIAEAARLYASGQSLAQIGAHLGVDHGTVWRQVRKRGVTIRDTHGRER